MIFFFFSFFPLLFIICDYQDIDDTEPISSQEAWTAADQSSGDIAVVTDERPRVDSIARMMEGPPFTDEDFDTDVEDDFAPGKYRVCQTPLDNFCMILWQSMQCIIF